MKRFPAFLAAFVLSCVAQTVAFADKPLDIGLRRELFVDDYLIERLSGDIAQQLQKPVPHEVVLVSDQPWEGNTSAYYCLFDDNGLYRMYYRGAHYDEVAKRETHRELTCYAESKDGIHWTKPELGLFEFNGSKQNNIVWDGNGTHCFTAFKDANPECRPEARYKAISSGHPSAKHGLYAFQSADGVRWSLIDAEPVITKGAFDSQNLAFWDPHAKLYREYHRTFVDGVRAIMTGTSKDFLHWTDPVLLEYPGSPAEHLYTNAVRAYERAPHILIGFPTRFLPDQGERVEPIFMSSRDGRVFRRWKEAVIPEDAPEDRGGNRSNYMTWGLLQLPGDDKHLSVYATEAYYTGPASRVRRFTYRVDGFVAVHGGEKGGELLTKPLVASGKQLTINFATKGEGTLRVELQDAAGKPLEGFALADCPPLRGDAIEQTVAWKNGNDVSKLSEQPIRVRFELKSADLFAMKFCDQVCESLSFQGRASQEK